MARHVRVAAALAAVASAALLAGCGGGSDGVFDREEFGFTFEYPTDFTESDDVKIDENLGSEAAASYGIGLDDDNVILVQRYDIEATVTDSNLDQVKRQLDALLSKYVSGTSTTPTEVAGLPALTADGVPVATVSEGESRFVFFFDGDVEYELNCQSTPAHRDEIEAACDQALETLSLN